MIQAVIFDMDGLLIDSEPLWHEAEASSFSQAGISLTQEQCLETQGLRVDKVVEYWFERYPCDSISKKDMEEMIQKEIIRIIQEKGVTRSGVKHVLEFIKDKDVKIALASSSADAIIDVVLERLQIRDNFEIICSAQHESHGKPHPAVYLSTAKKLQIDPGHCLALEDTITGALSAKSARMKCLIVPDESIVGDKRLAIADEVLHSLEDFNEEVWKKLND